MIPLVSIVVPTFRRPDLLDRCLQALACQHFGSMPYEVIVADDGEDPSVDLRLQQLELALNRAQHARLRWRCVRPSGAHGPAAARNAGWRAAEAPLIAFTDDDTVPDREWLREGCRAMRAHPDWVALSGRVVVPAPEGLPSDHALMTQGLERAEFVTANAFVRRDALQRIDGFDERFRRAWREDSDLQFRLEALGPLGRCEQAIVLHPVRPAPFAISVGQQRNAFYEALLYAKHPQAYRTRIAPQPPWLYYLILLCTLGAVALAAASALGAALGAAAAALLGVGVFALRRLRRTKRSPEHVAEMLVTSAVIPYLSIYWRLRGAWHFRTPFF